MPSNADAAAVDGGGPGGGGEEESPRGQGMGEIFWNKENMFETEKKKESSFFAVAQSS